MEPPIIRRIGYTFSKGKETEVQGYHLTNDDLPEDTLPYRDALVIKMDIKDMIVHRILVEIENLVNVMYYDAFTQLGLARSQLKEVWTTLSGFNLLGT